METCVDANKMIIAFGGYHRSVHLLEEAQTLEPFKIIFLYRHSERVDLLCLRCHDGRPRYEDKDGTQICFSTNGVIDRMCDDWSWCWMQQH